VGSNCRRVNASVARVSVGTASLSSRGGGSTANTSLKAALNSGSVARRKPGAVAQGPSKHDCLFVWSGTCAQLVTHGRGGGGSLAARARHAPAGSNKTSHAGWVLNRKQSKGSGLIKQVAPAPALGCIQRTIRTYVCCVLHAELAVGGRCAPPGAGPGTSPYPRHPSGSQRAAASAPPAAAAAIPPPSRAGACPVQEAPSRAPHLP
jgi:hypothetical protein